MTDDTADRGLSRDDLQYFNEQFYGSNVEYWRRLGAVDFRGRTVLDIGCGHGALSLHAAQQGATGVVGVDINAHAVDFARRNIDLNYPQFSSVITFHNGPLEEVTDSFDLAVSKDSFEHIDDLSGMMQSIAARLNDGGVLVTGFSPLYFSPFGDHGRYWGGSRRIPSAASDTARATALPTCVSSPQRAHTDCQRRRVEQAHARAVSHHRRRARLGRHHLAYQ